MIKCPNCSGEMVFDPKLQKIKCEYCGSTFTEEELKDKVKTNKEVEPTDGECEGKSFSCSQCGAKLMTFDDTAITFCSYCGSQAMLEGKTMKYRQPEYIIPFKKTKDECIEAYKKVVSKFLYAPGYIKSDFILEKFRGIYMPYCIYDIQKQGTIENKGSKYAYSSGDYTYYNDYQISADIDISYEGVSYDLSSKFYDNFSTAIPFNYKEAVPFNPSYMAGYYADSDDVSESVYEDKAKELITPDVISRLRKNKEFSRYGCSSPSVSNYSYKKKFGVFPVYFLAIRNKGEQTVHYAVVNGQTGKVAADLPIDFTKYIISSLIISLIIFAVINSFLVLTPIKVTFVAIIAAVISFFLSFMQSKKLSKKEAHLDDKGMFYVTKGAGVKTKGIFKFLYKEFIAIVIPIFPVITQAVDDSYYYIASIISLCIVVLSFSDLVKEHNLLVSNKLPQLEKRGGDKSE